MLLIALVWLIAIGAGIVALIVVFGLWGWATYQDTMLFEDKLEADPSYPTDHVHVPPPVDIPLGPRNGSALEDGDYSDWEAHTTGIWGIPKDDEGEN